MKVLWFSNTSCNASEYLGDGPVGGGWLKSLDRALQNEVELHIAFYYPKRDNPFKYQSTLYYPISKGNWKLKAILGIFWGGNVQKEEQDKYIKIIEEINPDIIHIHGTENAYGCIIPKIKKPIVVSIQGCMTVYHHKFLSAFSLRELILSSFYRGKGIRQFIRNKSYRRSYREFGTLAEREQLYLKEAQYIIGRTAWDRRITSILAPSSNYYHGDELLRNSFYSMQWQRPDNETFIIHSTTSNSPYKGFETICESLYILREIKSLNVMWQVAGLDEYDTIVRITKKKLKERFPRNGIIYLGSLDEKQLVDSLCRASVYVSPSHIENSPNSLCEAMLIGIPCIATFAGGTASILVDRAEGILIQDGDPWSMAWAILEIYSNPKIAQVYGKNAREKALIRHNSSRVVRCYLDIYKDIIRKQKKYLT